MTTFPYAGTIPDFYTLDDGEMLEGYLDGFHGAPPPDVTRSRGYCHGWQNGMIESNRMPKTAAYEKLNRAFQELTVEQPSPHGRLG